MKKRPAKKLRVAIVIDDFYPASGGIARSVQTQINELIRLGHEVTLIAPKHHLQAPDDCQTIIVPSFYIPRTPSYMCIIGLSRRIAKKISRQASFDIVHSQTERGALILAARIANHQNIPHIHSFHANLAGTHETNPQASFWGSMAYLLLINPLIALASKKRFSDDVVIPQPSSDASSFFARFDWHSFATIASRVDSYTTPARFVQHRINECSTGLTGKGHIVPTGVNQLFSDAIARAEHKKSANGKSDETVRFLCVSRLSKEKRVDAAIEAFIEAGVPNSRLDVVGSGDQLQSLRSLAKSHKSIFFHEHISGMDELAALYTEADAFIMPSYRFDTQAITLSEAAVAGLPIVYCDDRLDVGVAKSNSLLANNQNPSAIAIQILRLRDQALRQEMSTASKRIAKTLQPASMTAKYLDIYRELIANKSKLSN